MKKEQQPEMDLQGKLISIQSELKVPKGNYNSFGKYKYRSAEDILEAVKPLCIKHEVLLNLTDEIAEIGGKLFLVATVSINLKLNFISSKGYAQLGEHKGMSSEQCTGTASSYARKYALNGLFLIDETEADPDSQKSEPAKEVATLPLLPENKKESVIDFLQKGGTIEQIKKKYTLNESQIHFFEQILKTK